MNVLDKKTILVVEDEADLREVYRDVFEFEGAKVIEAADGEEGWKAFSEHPVDLVVSDVRMPKVSGVDLLKQIKSVDSGRACPVIIVSGLAEIAEDEVIRLGAAAFVRKPCDLVDLVEILKKILTS